MSKKVGRNDPCPCGSGKKYKNCCFKNKNQVARYTAEGKFKFSAEVVTGSGKEQDSCTQLFQRVAADSLTAEHKEALGAYHRITKNKEVLGKKAIRKAKAKEERNISDKLQQHSFSVMDVSSTPDQGPEEFIPTDEDYRE